MTMPPQSSDSKLCYFWLSGNLKSIAYSGAVEDLNNVKSCIPQLVQYITPDALHSTIVHAPTRLYCRHNRPVELNLFVHTTQKHNHLRCELFR